MWGTGGSCPVKMAFLGQPHFKTRTNTTGGVFIMEFYKVDEVNTHRYFKTPKELFHNKCYRVNLSTDAKLVYSILLDRFVGPDLSNVHVRTYQI